MNQPFLDAIRRNLVQIKLCLDLNQLNAYLIQEQIITFEDHALLQAIPISGDRNLKFVEILITKGPRAFREFLRILSIEQPFLHELMVNPTGLDIDKIVGTSGKLVPLCLREMSCTVREMGGFSSFHEGIAEIKQILQKREEILDEDSAT
ncbi:hypothetical protein CAPTEDRAFT_207276 [Capitella teleta]|uniref:CARD domain-containing protein n=1 Tax=Capitella teleta TaxID=283909 RepID=R7UP37_CAPTE|nr:hypothetical protein CAPTEDRAFT_207276 [Capitella teleta]|eukprot:ELU07965.1 hypothetical protein CAPTEDRAFT_207276 [Capitella teleta]